MITNPSPRQPYLSPRSDIGVGSIINYKVDTKTNLSTEPIPPVGLRGTGDISYSSKLDFLKTFLLPPEKITNSQNA